MKATFHSKHTVQSRRKILACVLLLTSLIYICFELIFNALLLDTASNSVFDIDQFEHIEMLGRTLSGIGVSLLLVSLMKDLLSRSRARMLLGSLMIFAFAWPVTFFAQKVLVDTLIIDSASAEQLKQATTANVFRQAMSAEALVIEGLDYDAFDDGPANKTFAALFSSLVLLGESEAGFIHRSMQQVIQSYVQTISRHEQAEWIESHQQAYTELSSAYQNEYLTGSHEYNERHQNLTLEVTQSIAEVERSVQDLWEGYQQALVRREEEALRQAQEHAPELMRYFSTYNSRCIRNGNVIQRCASEASRQYYQALDKAGISRVSSRFWMPYQEGSFLNRAGNFLLDVTTQGYNYSRDISHYQRRFLALPEGIERFERQTGYQVDIERFPDFRAHAQTSIRLRNQLIEMGMALPERWHIDDTATLRTAAREHIVNTIDKEWTNSIAEQGLDLPPNLPWAEFQAHPSVQNKLANLLGELYVSGYRPSWSDSQFHSNVIAPKIDEQVGELMAQWQAAVSEFEAGGRYHELGRSNVRAAVVPPIAMMLSLLLIAFNILKFPRELFAVFFSKQQMSKSKWRHIISFVYVAALLMMVIFLPLKLVDNPLGQDSNQITTHLMQQVDDNTGPLASFGLNWVMHAQPILYPAGNALKEHLDLLSLSEPMVPIMLDWDRIVLDR